MTSAITLSELIGYALHEARQTYNINVSKYLQIINLLEESKIQVSTFNEFYSYYDMLLNKTRNYLSEEEYTTMVNNKPMLCSMILNIFNKLT